MKNALRYFVTILAAAMLLAMPAEAKKVRGKVSGPQQEPLSGVIVTDGYHFTKTAADGSFSFGTHKDARFIYVVTPSGYMPDYSSGVPQFFLPIEGTKNFEFSLNIFSTGKGAGAQSYVNTRGDNNAGAAGSGQAGTQPAGVAENSQAGAQSYGNTQGDNNAGAAGRGQAGIQTAGAAENSQAGTHDTSKDFTIFSVSDPQMANKKHFMRFSGRPLGDLCGMARLCSAQRPTVGIALGDIAWNNLELFESYRKAIAKTGIPFFSVIGNHDFIQNKSGLEAARSYEDSFGPCNWAFFIGGDLVIGLKNIKFKASGKDDPSKSSNNYKEGYPEETLTFLKGLLKYVGKDTHLFIAQHSPTIPSVKPIEDADKFTHILEGYSVDILSGHTHTKDSKKISENITDHNAAAIGGAWWATDLCRDGTPRGWEIISSTAEGRSFRWHNIDYPDDYQVEFIGMDKSVNHCNSVLALAWEADEDWTCTWTEDGRDMGALELSKDRSVSYAREILDTYGGVFSKIPGYKLPFAGRHYYVATPSQYAEKVTMKVQAPDGRTWEHEFDIRGSYIDLQAHRGGAGLMPENTFTSIKNAMDLGVNTLEFDLHISADGKIVVSHDSYFHPRYSTRPDGSLIQTEDPKEYLYKMPYDSIAKYDVGLRPNTVWPGQKKVAEKKPLAGEVIDFAENYAREKGFSPFRYNIEIKSRKGKGEGKNWPGYKEFCDKCMELLLSKGLGDRLVVQSFDVRALEYIHEKYPEVKLSYLTSKESDVRKLLGNLSFTPTWWSPEHKDVTDANVAYCHALGVKVVTWSVDEPEDIERVAACRVDAIISNYPDRLIEIIRKLPAVKK